MILYLVIYHRNYLRWNTLYIVLDFFFWAKWSTAARRCACLLILFMEIWEKFLLLLYIKLDYSPNYFGKQREYTIRHTILLVPWRILSLHCIIRCSFPTLHCIFQNIDMMCIIIYRLNCLSREESLLVLFIYKNTQS